MSEPSRPPSRRRAFRPLVAAMCALATAAATACEQPSVRWLDAAPLATTQPSPLVAPSATMGDSSLADTSALAGFLLTQDLLREAGAAALVTSHLDSTPAAAESLSISAVMSMSPVPPAPLTSLGSGEAPVDAARCARSLRMTDAPGRGRVAVWWSKRGASRVALLAAWRDSATAPSAATAGSGDTSGTVGTPGAWRGPIIVDSLDQGTADAKATMRGALGCMRSAPSVVVDDRHGYVHVAYTLVGPEGAGVFYAHQMASRSAFEPPQAVVYGDRLGAARVAASGDVVAVAYEDPNGAGRGRIAVAVSRTSGHIFTERMVASSDNENARDPFVAVRGRAVVVGWSDVPAAGDMTFRVRRARVE